MSSSPDTQTPEVPAAQLSPHQLVIFTPAAVRKVMGFSETNPEAEGKELRLYVQGGGCSGFEYGFKFDDRDASPLKLDFMGAEVIGFVLFREDPIPGLWPHPQVPVALGLLTLKPLPAKSS